MTRAPLILLALLSTAALAQDAPEPATPEKLPPAPATLGTLTPKRLAALRTYKAQRLQVRAETEYRGGGVSTFSSMSYGYPQAMGTGVIIAEPISTFRTWGVYRGPERLSTPDFLTLTNAIKQRDSLVAEIDKSRRASKIWFTGAGLGMAAIVTGIVGMGAGGVDTYAQYNSVALVGTTVTIGCLLGASFPAAKASKLYRYPGASMNTDAANGLAHEHNEQLRQKLGIQPDEAWLLDLGATD
jgi:hypothetical protein